MGLEFGKELVVGQDWNACMFFEVGEVTVAADDVVP
jgi:hypothetical protein